MPEKSVGDPDTTLITVPNIPFWTGVHKGQKKGGYAKTLAYGVVNDNGLAEPFIQGKGSFKYYVIKNFTFFKAHPPSL